LAAVISRNSYGSLVLNTSRVMFADVDYPARMFEDLVAALKKLWGRLTGSGSPAMDRDAELLRRFQEVVETQPGLGIRVYRTFAGYRLLVTSQTFAATSDEAVKLLERFGSDRLYVRLCKSQ